MDEDNKIVKVEKPTIEKSGFKPAALRKSVDEEEQRRHIINDYIKRNMIKGTDYDVIPFVRNSKPTLLKAGSEKLCSLMHFRPEFSRDDDTWEMSGKKTGLFAFVCRLYTDNGKLVGEGRGAADMAEKSGWTHNNAIKIAEKRAQMDAVLRTAGLSEFFTQDLEDQKKQVVADRQFARSGSPAVYTKSMSRDNLLVEEPTLKVIFAKAKEKGLTNEVAASIIKDKFHVTSSKQLSRVQASQFLTMLNQMPTFPEKKEEPKQEELSDSDVDEIVAKI